MMTVYVDDSQIRAKVGRINGIWSHLFADTKEELHKFAIEKLKLKREWFQDKSHGLWHYDVTEPKRQLAIQCGATQVTWRDTPRLMRERDEHDKKKSMTKINHEKLDKVYEDIRNDVAFNHLRQDFRNNPLVPGEGDNPIAMLIGEAPGAYEAVRKRPFVGPAGIVLRQLMSIAGLYATGVANKTDWAATEWLPNCWLTNVVKYRPLRNRTPSLEEIKDSRAYLTAEWRAIGSPDIVITIGATALTAITGRQQSVVAKAGQMFSNYKSEREPQAIVVWPMIHPAFALRNERIRPIVESHWNKLGEWLENRPGLKHGT